MSTPPDSHRYRFRSPEIEVNAANPFEQDKLEREPFVTATADLLTAIREPFVVALNAPWGSGKTTTLGLLKAVLNTNGVTTANFNAWEVDDATDPLVPLVASLHEKLQHLTGGLPAASPATLQKLKTLGSSIAKRGLVAAVKVATAGVVDIPELVEAIGTSGGDAAEAASQGVAEDLIDTFKREKQASEEFRNVLGRLVALARKQNDAGDDPPPVVLMIDELDRCRPTFAVAMLERIKHFFDIPGLVFLLAVDLDQLKASTRKVYGADLDAAEYLRRFVDLELRLPRARAGKMVDQMLKNCGADTFFASRSMFRSTPYDRSSIVKTFEELATDFDISHRVVQRMVSRLMLVFRQTPKDQRVYPIVTVFLIFLRMHHAALLPELVSGRMTAGEAMDIVRSSKPGGEAFYQSKIGLLIEGDLLTAHRDLQYVKDLAAEGARRSDALDAASERNRELLARLGHRSWDDEVHLDVVMERIDLVATDLTDESR